MTPTQTEPMNRNIQYSTRWRSQRDLRHVLRLMNTSAIEPPPEDIIDELFADEHTAGVVAEVKVKQQLRIIAHLFLTHCDDHMVIQDCMVHPKYRRLRIGTTLIDYAKRSAAANDCSCLVNHCGEYNLDGQLFLRDQGFICAEQEVLGGNTFLNMEWTPAT